MKKQLRSLFKDCLFVRPLHLKQSGNRDPFGEVLRPA